MPSPVAITGSFVAMEAAANSTVAWHDFRGDLRRTTVRRKPALHAGTFSGFLLHNLQA